VYDLRWLNIYPQLLPALGKICLCVSSSCCAFERLLSRLENGAKTKTTMMMTMSRKNGNNFSCAFFEVILGKLVRRNVFLLFFPSLLLAYIALITFTKFVFLVFTFFLWLLVSESDCCCLLYVLVDLLIFIIDFPNDVRKQDVFLCFPFVPKHSTTTRLFFMISCDSFSFLACESDSGMESYVMLFCQVCVTNLILHLLPALACSLPSLYPFLWILFHFGNAAVSCLSLSLFYYVLLLSFPFLLSSSSLACLLASFNSSFMFVQYFFLSLVLAL